MRLINNIVIHCSDTPYGKHFDSTDIKKWHLQRGWSDIGYHFIILIDGTIEIGRDIKRQGAHVKNENKNSIGICYIGGGEGKDTRTLKQKESLVYLISTLRRMFHLAKVTGHKDFPDVKKSCPCFDAESEYKNL